MLLDLVQGTVDGIVSDQSDRGGEMGGVQTNGEGKRKRGKRMDCE